MPISPRRDLSYIETGTGTPVRVKNSYNPEAEGTLITAEWTEKAREK